KRRDIAAPSNMDTIIHRPVCMGPAFHLQVYQSVYFITFIRRRKLPISVCMRTRYVPAGRAPMLSVSFLASMPSFRSTTAPRLLRTVTDCIRIVPLFCSVMLEDAGFGYRLNDASPGEICPVPTPLITTVIVAVSVAHSFATISCTVDVPLAG